jgi:hypothetical protein
MKLRREADLQRGYALGRRVLAHLRRHAGDGVLRIEQGEGEGEARERVGETHARGEGEVGWDVEAALLGERREGGRTEGAVEVAMQVGERAGGAHRERSYPRARSKMRTLGQPRDRRHERRGLRAPPHRGVGAEPCPSSGKWRFCSPRGLARWLRGPVPDGPAAEGGAAGG